MRIIAGSTRGRAIAAPKGMETRPTQDYVRESLFNILMRDTPDARVLDLFAGSGALAMEALSRGAAEAVLVDSSSEAIRCVNQNAETAGFTGLVTVIRADWQTALKRLSGMQKTFSLVFLDPPYRLTDTAAQCARMAELGLLEPGALIVIEHSKDNVPALDSRFTVRDRRKYGRTEIHFFIYQGGVQEHA